MIQCSSSRIKLLLSAGMVLSEVSELIFLTILDWFCLGKSVRKLQDFYILFSAFSFNKRFCLSGSGGKWKRDLPELES